MKSLPDKAASFLMLVAETITPETADLDVAARAEMEGIIDQALMDRDAATRKQIGSFLNLIRIGPVLRFGKSFDRLRSHQRHSVLSWFESGPVGLFRQGFWGLKTMVYMGYYGRPEARREIGYTPDLDGVAASRHE